MKNIIIRATVLTLAMVFGFGFFALNTYAEEATDGTTEDASENAPATSISIMPVSRTLQIASESTYDGTLTVSNDGDADIKVKAYAAPYSYVKSEEDGSYQLGFSNETNYTQLSRWISIEGADGNYTKEPTFTVKAHESYEIKYKIATPKNIPAGGQYAVIFVQTMSNTTNSSGIKTEASAGMVVYGRSTEGESVVSAEIKDLEILQGGESKEAPNNNFRGTAKVGNTGNVDFFAHGILRVEPIIGFASYETDINSNSVSVIPESERMVSDEWTETPNFGIYKVTWTVNAGDYSETTERVIFLISPLAIIIFIIVLTAIVLLVIMVVRKRKERRSRLAV